MSKANRSAHRAAAARSADQAGSKAGWFIGAAVVLVIAVAAVIAITAGSDSTAVPAGLEQVRPVAVTGDPLPALEDPANDPAIGTAAPQLSGQSFDGTPVVVEPGRPTLLVFLAHWCPHCQREVPVLTAWEQAGDVPAGVDVIGIATKTDASAANYPPSAWLEDESFPWPVMADSADSTAAVAMGLPGYPYFVLLDADGAVFYRDSGEIDPSVLTGIIDSMLAG